MAEADNILNSLKTLIIRADNGVDTIRVANGRPAYSILPRRRDCTIL